MRTRELAEKAWTEINTGHVGVETGISILEKHIKEAVKAEREEIVKDIANNHWSYDNITFSMWFRSIYCLCRTPRQFFGTYFKVIQLALAQKVNNRV